MGYSNSSILHVCAYNTLYNNGWLGLLMFWLTDVRIIDTVLYTNMFREETVLLSYL